MSQNPPETMREIVLQEMNEERFNRKHIDAKIKAAILSNVDMMVRLEQGIELVTKWVNTTFTYVLKDGTKKVFESKMARVAQLKEMDIPAMVMDIFVGIAYYQRPELFTSASAQMSSRLKFSDKTAAITTVAELMAILCQTDAFDIHNPSKFASLSVQSRIELPEQLIHFIEHSQFLPPMVCTPLELTHNFSSGYLTHNDSLILGSGNHHDGDICLDTLNLQNSVALKLDTDFLCKVEEEPSFDLDTPEKIDQWQAFKKQSYYFYSLMEQQGNRFYFNHKVDKRGRSYSHGYHLNPQGTSFKKAMLEFADEEIVEWGEPS